MDTSIENSQNLATPSRVWMIHLDGQEITAYSLNDDTINTFSYFRIKYEYSFLSARQLDTLDWLITQGYPVIVDEERKVIARQRLDSTDLVITTMNDVINNNIDIPEWVSSIKTIDEVSKEYMQSIRDDYPKNDQYVVA